MSFFRTFLVISHITCVFSCNWQPKVVQSTILSNGKYTFVGNDTSMCTFTTRDMYPIKDEDELESPNSSSVLPGLTQLVKGVLLFKNSLTQLHDTILLNADNLKVIKIDGSDFKIPQNLQLEVVNKTRYYNTQYTLSNISEALSKLDGYHQNGEELIKYAQFMAQRNTPHLYVYRLEHTMYSVKISNMTLTSGVNFAFRNLPSKLDLDAIYDFVFKYGTDVKESATYGGKVELLSGRPLDNNHPNWSPVILFQQAMMHVFQDVELLTYGGSETGSLDSWARSLFGNPYETKSSLLSLSTLLRETGTTPSVKRKADWIENVERRVKYHNIVRSTEVAMKLQNSSLDYVQYVRGILHRNVDTLCPSDELMKMIDSLRVPQNLNMTRYGLFCTGGDWFDTEIRSRKIDVRSIKLLPNLCIDRNFDHSNGCNSEFVSLPAEVECIRLYKNAMCTGEIVGNFDANRPIQKSMTLAKSFMFC